MFGISSLFSLVDVLWLSLASCFLVAFCVHKISHRKHGASRLYMIFQDLIRYGKTKNSKRAEWLRVFDLPKRWFWHFYITSVCWNVFLLLSHVNLIYHRQPYPVWLTTAVDILTGVSSAESQVPRMSTVLVQLLLCVHSLRRLLECLFVSVFSDGVIHLAHYVLGLVYYILLGLTVPCVDRVTQGAATSGFQLDWVQLSGCVLFLLSSLLQHQSIVLLARLRTGKSGTVETLSHRMPKGGCFELVSCPHYFAELLLYIALGFVLGGLSRTWWLVVLFVFSNQALAGLLCHELYINKFNSYPKQRKAFIPFVL